MTAAIALVANRWIAGVSEARRRWEAVKGEWEAAPPNGVGAEDEVDPLGEAAEAAEADRPPNKPEADTREEVNKEKMFSR